MISLKEQLARTTLRNLRLQGHTYIELRENGKRFIFFCTLCHAPCYSDTILHGHLNGQLHKERLSCAKSTLLGPNPWPFSDGVLFFDTTNGEDDDDKSSVSSDDNRLAIVTYDENREACDYHHHHQRPSPFSDSLLVSGLLIKERTVDVEAKFIGFGRIAARLFESKGRSTWIDKIWCEWLGDETPYDDKVPEHDFAIVTFSYFYNLGRLGFLDEPRHLLENGEENSKKRKLCCFSDSEDTNGSSEEDSSLVRLKSKSSNALAADYDDSLVSKRLIKNRSVRREIRRQQKIFSERVCEVCRQKMLPGKDAAAILNLKTGNLACGSRNLLGAFHLFHVSCAVHWFLFCESEIVWGKLASRKGKKRRKTTQGSSGNWTELLTDGNCQIFSVFCPECQGTGINIEGDEIERDTFPLSQTWKFQVKVGEGRKAWVKNPEKLENCSTGFHFPKQDEEPGQIQVQDERVQSMKMIRFYRVEM